MNQVKLADSRASDIRDQQDESQNNISSYIQSLDVANVLSAELSGIDNNNEAYIDPNIEEPDGADSNNISNNQSELNREGQKDTEMAVEAHNRSGIPPLPEGVDPKKMCPFCQKTFSHPGSMGRHLDLKKGTRLHPVDLIEKLRADVKRRGDLVKIKERRRLRAKRYNSKKEVKERTKVQRRVRDKLLRAKRRYVKSFYNKLGKPELESNPTFPRLVFYFLQPGQWPHDPPTLETYRLLCAVLNEKFLPGEEEYVKIYDEIMQMVHTASENWLVLAESTKQDIWIRELRRAAVDSLANSSLYDLRYRDEWVLKQAQKRVDNINNNVTNEDDGESSDSDKSVEGGSDNEEVQRGSNEEQEEEEEYYNQVELAAVAEAVVNDTQKDNDAHLDPQLIK
jgi:hypothetical protein